MTAQQLIELLQLYCKRSGTKLTFDCDVLIVERTASDAWVRDLTPAKLLDVLNNGHERECHKQLLSLMLKYSGLVRDELMAAIKASRNVLAQITEPNG